MAVSELTNGVIGNGNGVARTFSFSPVIISKSSDLVVVKVATDGAETPLSEGSSDTTYSVSVSSFPGTGSVDYPASGGTLLVTGESISMRSVRKLTQSNDLENQGGYFADTQETSLDKLTYIAQQQQVDIDRSIKIPVSDVSGTPVEFLSSSNRALKTLIFDALGKMTVGTPTLQTVLGVDVTDTSAALDKMVSNLLSKGWEDLKLILDPVRIASAVNSLRITESITGVNPTFEVIGSDTDIGLILKTKGTGRIVLPTGGVILTAGDIDVTAGDINIAGGRINANRGADIASGATVDLATATGNFIHITGVTTINSFGNVPAGAEFIVIFDSALSVDNSANILMPNLLNRAMAAGDKMQLVSEGSSVFRVLEIMTFDGRSIKEAWKFSSLVDLTSGSPTIVSLISSLNDVSEIEIYIEGFSTNTADQSPLIQIGDSGGLEPSGYTGQAGIVVTAGSVEANNTGFLLTTEADHDAATVSTFSFTLSHMGSNVWAFKSFGSSATPTQMIFVGNGVKTLTAALDRVSITTSGGSATFDGGTAHVRSR